MMQNLAKTLFPYSFKKSSLLLWVILTAIYLCFGFFLGDEMLPSSVLPALLGLFVPYGFWNFLLSNEPNAPFALFLLILFPFILVSLDAFLVRCKISPPKHYLFSLLFLLIWTLLVDFVIHGHYRSLYLIFAAALGIGIDDIR
jgi:hypothetical protein